MAAMITGKFPQLRLRRLRNQTWVRDLATENSLTVKDLILPIFICMQGEGKEIIGLPGVQRYCLDDLPDFVRDLESLGIIAVMLFPKIPDSLKNDRGTEAVNHNNLLCDAIKIIKAEAPEIGVITDVALDPYTNHGHDGVILKGQIDNDATIEMLCRQALVQAQAGADAIAPSDMMDGRIGMIRNFLDQNGCPNTLIISYAVKYASAFYGPFRNAVGVSGLKILPNKKTYQLNPANSQEALREAALDVKEGADMLIVKPGLPYLDIISKVSQTFNVPTIGYQVSGEYAAIMAASQNGWLDADQAMMEAMLAFKRSGATGIITYYAARLAELLG